MSGAVYKLSLQRANKNGFASGRRARNRQFVCIADILGIPRPSGLLGTSRDLALPVVAETSVPFGRRCGVESRMLFINLWTVCTLAKGVENVRQ